MTAKIITGTVYGIDGIAIEVEVDISHGLPAFNIVGLPEAAVKESKERVRASVKNSGFDFPSDRITVNLAPADVRKEGSSFDLPIALGILSAMGVVKAEDFQDHMIIGELSLDGRIKGVRGILPISIAARREGKSTIVVPTENGREAAIVQDLTVYGVDYLIDLVHYFRGDGMLALFPGEKLPEQVRVVGDGVDFSDIKGNPHAKRALEIAASGAHNILMIGPPGSGKTMLARRIPTILPPLSYDEAIETTKLHSIAGLLGNNGTLVTDRPFRSPHHTVSDAGMIGGGQMPRPGEVSLAHNGVLFLDEFPEFKRNALDGMRQPMEDGLLTISRVNHSLTFPARFMLVAAMNPCPCGYFGDPRHSCVCNSAQIRKYRSRISGPLLDRIDIQIEVPPVTMRELATEREEERSDAIRQRVSVARAIQEKRYGGKRIYANSHMSSRMIRKYCTVSSGAQKLLERAVEKYGLSPRAYHRILKVSRTIADLETSENIREEHIAEAIQYRALDKRIS